MMTKEQILYSFIINTSDADIAVIEGNRGIYDGLDSSGNFSTASLAKLLKAPVILIVDCSMSSTTIAALILGCQMFDPEVNIKGVILNNVGKKRQAIILKEAVEQKCKIPVIGIIPKIKENIFPQRHMGLVTIEEHEYIDKSISIMREIVQKTINLNKIIDLAIQNSGDLSFPLINISNVEKISSPKLTIGIIKDSAFCFYYPENLTYLEKNGIIIIEINSLTLKNIPDEIDALYIGGGFPETHVKELSSNVDFHNSLKNLVEKGLPVYAECGGLIFLGKSLYYQDKEYNMSGILPINFRLENFPIGHGYTILKTDKENPFFEIGTIIRGHEFHYSRVVEWDKTKLDTVFQVERGYGIDGKRDGFVYKNVLASYFHIHALAFPQWIQSLILKAKYFNTLRKN